MDEFERLQRKQEARRRLAAQRSRAGRLRGRVVAGSLVCFVLLWGIVFGQMVTGNDPVLAGKTGKVARPRPSARATEAIETTEPEEVEDGVATPAPVEAEAPAEAEPEPEPLTTGQS